MTRQEREEFENDTYKTEPDGHIQAYDEIISALGFEPVSVKPHGVETIQADRENDYGDALVSHQSIANFWNEYLRRKGDFEVEIELDAIDVAVMLSLMKVSRLAYKRKHDSLLDFASYADFALQFEDKE